MFKNGHLFYYLFRSWTPVQQWCRSYILVTDMQIFVSTWTLIRSVCFYGLVSALLWLTRFMFPWQQIPLCLHSPSHPCYSHFAQIHWYLIFKNYCQFLYISNQLLSPLIEIFSQSRTLKHSYTVSTIWSSEFILVLN